MSQKHRKWTPVPGTPYEVTTEGQIRRIGPPAHPASVRLISGIRHVQLPGGHNAVAVGRLILQAFTEVPPRFRVTRKNGKASDDRLDNLIAAPKQLPATLILPGEEWKPIPSTFGTYEASTEGRIRRTKSKRPLNTWPLNGYRMVTLCGARVLGQATTHPAHRLVAEAFHGEAPTNAEAHHKNRHRADNRPANLEWRGPKQHGKLHQGRTGATQRAPTEPLLARIAACSLVLFASWPPYKAARYLHIPMTTLTSLLTQRYKVDWVPHLQQLAKRHPWKAGTATEKP